MSGNNIQIREFNYNSPKSNEEQENLSKINLKLNFLSVVVFLNFLLLLYVVFWN